MVIHPSLILSAILLLFSSSFVLSGGYENHSPFPYQQFPSLANYYRRNQESEVPKISMLPPSPRSSLPIDLVPVRGFEFCSNLNGALFDANAQISVSAFMNFVKARSIQLPPSLDHLKHGRKTNIGDVFVKFWQSLWKTVTTFKNHFKLDKRRTTLLEIQSFFPKMIDTVAQMLYEQELSKYKIKQINKQIGKRHSSSVAIDLREAKKFSCYVAADGANSLISYSNSPILKYVDGNNYFPALGFSAVTVDLAVFEHLHSTMRINLDRVEFKPLRSDPSPDDHHLAYFLMAKNDIEQIKNLLKEIYDDNVVILIHVDERNPEMKTQLNLWLRKQFKTIIAGRSAFWNFDLTRVRVMEQSFSIIDADASKLMALLAGYFELLSINYNWEYVINLEEYDFPLISNNEIYKQLKENGNVNYITYEKLGSNSVRNPLCLRDQTCNYAGQPFASSRANPAILQPDNTLKQLYKNMLGNRITGVPSIQLPFYKWTLFKNNPSMILHRSFIHVIRNSPTAMTYLAYLQFTAAPDATFFATIAANMVTKVPEGIDIYHTKVLNVNKWFENFKKSAKKGKRLGGGDISKIDSHLVGGDFFIRPIDIAHEPGLVSIIHEKRLNFEKKVFSNIKY